ncbi:MAG: hypothetical protein IJS97_01895 [Prevotella sp.]|nr:hypothetical protein [Prevotella sp.]
MDEDGDAVSEARFYRKNGDELVSITSLKSDGNGSSFWNALATQGQGVVHGSFSESILVFAEIGMYYAGLKLGETLDKKVIPYGVGR